MTTKKEHDDTPAVKDAEPMGSPELSSPKTPGTPSREPAPKGERPEEVKVALLDSNRQEIRRVMIPAADAGFRLIHEGQAFERVGQTDDGIATYALTT